MGLKSEAYENDLEGNYEPKQDSSLHSAFTGLRRKRIHIEEQIIRADYFTP